MNKSKHTLTAAFIAYICSAVANNFPPLLFVTFCDEFGLSLEQLGVLIVVNFAVQLSVDLLSSGFVDKIGYRASIVIAHALLCLGMVGIAVLPDLMQSPFAGLSVATFLYAVGSGLNEVLVSPIVESCPTDNKNAAMSLLHSFYCWGSVFTVLGTTLFFVLFGRENWRVLSLLWALIPLLNMVYVTRVPLYPVVAEEKSMSLQQLLHSRTFIVLFVVMFTAGASEVAMSQWASAFAESGLHVSKTVGDLLGPCLFAVMMGISRVVWAKKGSIPKIKPFLRLSCLLCIASYLIACLSPWPVVSLLGCGLCGFSVGILWPGTISLASSVFPAGGTVLFAFMALGGDIGCCSGPSLVGYLSAAFGDNLKIGLLFGAVFPLLMLLVLPLIKQNTKKG